MFNLVFYYFEGFKYYKNIYKFWFVFSVSEFY